MSSGVWMSRPERAWASGMLGVTTAARGNSFSRRAAAASLSSSRDPLVETITGSTTTFWAPYWRSFWAMTRMSPAEETMPTFTASGRMSWNTASICWPKNSGPTSKMLVTPKVFCTVSAVMAHMAYTPFTVIVFRSAWMPAPPLGSLPAMDRHVFMGYTPLQCAPPGHAAPGRRLRCPAGRRWRRPGQSRPCRPPPRRAGSPG